MQPDTSQYPLLEDVSEENGWVVCLNMPEQTQYDFKRAHLDRFIELKDMPEWSNEKAAELRAVGKEYGFSDEELAQVYDPRTIKVLHDAAQWKKLQSNPSVKNKVSQAKPVVKPGAKDGKQQANTQNRQLRDQLRKSGDERLAAKLIERML